MSDKYVLEVTWDEGVDLPSLIGPFDTEAEALDFDVTNIPNGVAMIRPLAFPYQRSGEKA